MGRTADTEITVVRDGVEVEVLVSAEIHGAEEDVGIMSPMLELLIALRLDTTPPSPIDLSSEEMEIAETRILEWAESDFYEE